MVCVYCAAPTQVVNSRHQRRSNNIWRRRKCLNCGSIFTTHETIDLESSLVFKRKDHDIQPFSKDQLLISVYECCKHRSTAAQDAAALSQTIIHNTLISLPAAGVIERDHLVEVVGSTLKRFDQTAATIYHAYHPATQR